jgi:hypothetical protein
VTSPIEMSLITDHGDNTNVTTYSYPKAEYFQLISDVLASVFIQ